MLVLSRKCQQDIKIGDDITIRVIRIKGNQVRLGIVAPGSGNIRRAEIEQQQAEPVRVSA